MVFLCIGSEDTIDLPAIKKKVSKALKVSKLGTGSSKNDNGQHGALTVLRVYKWGYLGHTKNY